ncbi:uncharacterized protein ARMOST_20115 [Armillaria ostoyae]|uniref:Transmembrane protein n=1 Tax=Armillaria ostoyae TaxID=47428 RepID=A0A284S6G2_ARMOS|nr:uncharacterized protein ARMOST_20115 [Armillaria ostoyae]
MTVEWHIDDDNCDHNCTEVDIFFDANLSPSDSQDHGPYNSNKPNTPTFIWNATNWLMGPHDYDPRNNFPIFRTNLITLESGHASLVYYPFDRHAILFATFSWSDVTYPRCASYNAQIFAFAQDRSTNESVSLVLASASALFPGLKITVDVPTDDPAYLEEVKPGNRVMDVIVTIERSTLVIVYCLVITLTIWLVTLMICCIMIATVMFSFRQRNEIVVVPVATVFAFTQLRSSMPGAPGGFGDILGIFCWTTSMPCPSIGFPVTMVGIYLFVNPDDPARRSFTIDDIGAALINVQKE